MKNRKTTVFFATLLLAANLSLWAQQLTVAVSAFDAKGGLSKDEAESVTELFIGELVKNRTVKVVDRNNFDKILSEMKFQESDWADSKKVAQLGKAINANGIIRGTIMSIGGQTVITATLLDINTAEILSSSRLQMRRIDEVFDKLPPFVAEIVQNLPNTSSQTGNASASTFYGAWICRRQYGPDYDISLIIDANKITWRLKDDYVVITNCTWTADNNSDLKTLSEYPKGFKVSGVVTDIKGRSALNFMPFYLFINKSDSNKIYFYYTHSNTSEIQGTDISHDVFMKIQ
jgi:TolB-like protein